MNEVIEAELTTRTFARLLLHKEVSLETKLSDSLSREVLQRILEIPIDEILAYVDLPSSVENFNVSDIPQFGKIETIADIPEIFEDPGVITLDYPQLGFMLKRDTTATLASNTKYGENHGKFAVQLGLICAENYKFKSSCITRGMKYYDKKEKIEIIARLSFRIPIIKQYLRNARNARINGFSLLYMLSESTRERRGSSIRNVLNCMYDIGHEGLNKRIKNIDWVKE